MKAVVFDIGGVLVDWQPHLAWLDPLGSRDAVEAFMARIDFPARNLRGDAGTPFSELAAELDDAGDAALLAAYVENYAKTVRQAVPGTWALVDSLLAHGVPLHAITNWSAETWPVGLAVHPRLGEIFGTTVVSGQVGLVKPDARIFEILLERTGLAAQDCLFIDDGAHNVAGAKAVGMDAVQFVGAQMLQQDLVARGFL